MSFFYYLITYQSNEIMSPNSQKILSDLPSEVLQEVVFKYLTCKDIRSIAETKSKRLTPIAEDYIQRQICE